MKIEIKLFGQLKEYFETSGIEMELPEAPLRVRELKAELLRQPGTSEMRRALVADSALASETQVLRDEDLIGGTGVYLLLPPVCGG